ncbi:hypothetical protein AS200_03915 [Streptomyces sp. CdTB01]|nr:hypothetical protein AS200_03915 [Streptomyces sp. CdTB01]
MGGPLSSALVDGLLSRHQLQSRSSPTLRRLQAQAAMLASPTAAWQTVLAARYSSTSASTDVVPTGRSTASQMLRVASSRAVLQQLQTAGHTVIQHRQDIQRNAVQHHFPLWKPKNTTLPWSLTMLK